jgi:hypothetical protein
MSSSNGAVVSERKVQRNRGKDIAAAMKADSAEFFGEIVTWQVRRDSSRTFSDVVNALSKAGLDPAMAKKIMPRAAFTRACKALKEKAVFDVIKDTADKTKFQMTKKGMQNEEWVYTKETVLVLDKNTGVLECKNKDVRDAAQKLLDAALEIRTTSDITHIVQKLFEKNGDLFSLRDQGGVYFVPSIYTPFSDKVEKFIEQLGGEMGRFPVPKGTKQGDKSIQTAVADAFRNLIKDHEESIDAFTTRTQDGTMKNAAERINLTRVKIEAYAHYLTNKSKELLKACDEAKKKLDERIKGIAEERENEPDEPQTIFGHSITQVLRWMGREGWTPKQAKTVMDARGFKLTESTLRGQLWVGRSGRYDDFGKPAELTAKEIKELEKERKAVAA